jgi:hypothetical protein
MSNFLKFSLNQNHADEKEHIGTDEKAVPMTLPSPAQRLGGTFEAIPLLMSRKMNRRFYSRLKSFLEKA